MYGLLEMDLNLLSIETFSFSGEPIRLILFRGIRVIWRVFFFGESFEKKPMYNQEAKKKWDIAVSKRDIVG